MAEGFARHYGAGLVNPASAGLAAARFIAPETRQVMLGKGIELTDQFPKDFEPAAAAQYDIIVNISGFVLPACDGPEQLEWEIPDPYGEDIAAHREARDEIERRVQRMLADLERDGTVTEFHAVGQRIASDLVRKPRLWQRFTRWR